LIAKKNKSKSAWKSEEKLNNETKQQKLQKKKGKSKEDRETKEKVER
jgi:hypothetical protein